MAQAIAQPSRDAFVAFVLQHYTFALKQVVNCQKTTSGLAIQELAAATCGGASTARMARRRERDVIEECLLLSTCGRARHGTGQWVESIEMYDRALTKGGDDYIQTDVLTSLLDACVASGQYERGFVSMIRHSGHVRPTGAITSHYLYIAFARLFAFETQRDFRLCDALKHVPMPTDTESTAMFFLVGASSRLTNRDGAANCTASVRELTRHMRFIRHAMYVGEATIALNLLCALYALGFMLLLQHSNFSTYNALEQLDLVRARVVDAHMHIAVPWFVAEYHYLRAIVRMRQKRWREATIEARLCVFLCETQFASHPLATARRAKAASILAAANCARNDVQGESID